jgi:phage terminase large subunit
LQNYFFKKEKYVRILDCIKARIIDRINLTCRLIGSGRFYVHDTCPEVIESLCSAVWEKDKDDIRLDNGTTNIDVLDAMEYALSSAMSSLIKSFNRGY